MSRIKNTAMIFAGILSVLLGVIGIFFPIMPTTPFLLLSAALFIRSSPRLYNWLTNNKVFGKYIKAYREGEGMPLKAKITTISLLWITIALTAIFLVPHISVRIILPLIAAGVTFHILRIKTYRKNIDNETDE